MSYTEQELFDIMLEELDKDLEHPEEVEEVILDLLLQLSACKFNYPEPVYDLYLTTTTNKQFESKHTNDRHHNLAMGYDSGILKALAFFTTIFT